jgi:hypothetical protein
VKLEQPDQWKSRRKRRKAGAGSFEILLSNSKWQHLWWIPRPRSGQVKERSKDGRD